MFPHFHPPSHFCSKLILKLIFTFFILIAFFSHFKKKKNRNNLDNQQRLRSPKRSGTTSLNNENEVKGNQDDIKYSNAMDRMDIYSDSNENAIKIGDDATDDDRPPRLPPRPPPRPRNTMSSETGMIYSCRFFLYILALLY